MANLCPECSKRTCTQCKQMGKEYVLNVEKYKMCGNCKHFEQFMEKWHECAHDKCLTPTHPPCRYWELATVEEIDGINGK